MVLAEDAIAIYKKLTANGIRVWLTGGWGIDALLGQQTRPHKDLDVIVLLDDVIRIWEILGRESFRLKELWSENRPAIDSFGNETDTAFVLVDSEDREIDLHALNLDDRGIGIPAWDAEGNIFTTQDLAGVGKIGGEAVQCISPEKQSLCHSGYQLPEYQLDDLELLQAKFALEMPDPWPFPWPKDVIARTTALRVETPPVIDGRLDEDCWQRALRSPRFADLVSGLPAVHDTCAAVLWDDDYLYVGYWIEEPFVQAKLTERDSLIYEENDVELFIAGQDTYYEFEINALGTLYEVFFIWEDAYGSGGFNQLPEFSRDAAGVRLFDGVGFQPHPRGRRIGFWNWDFPGLRSAVHVDGTLNDDSDRDRGWTVELALPWKGFESLAKSDGRSLPPRDGDVWRMDFSRFNQYKAAPPANDSGGWAWSPHGVWDSHIPELFVKVQFKR